MRKNNKKTLDNQEKNNYIIIVKETQPQFSDHYLFSAHVFYSTPGICKTISFIGLLGCVISRRKTFDEIQFPD